MAPRADFVSGYAPSGEAKIYFESTGAGPALVFVHAGVSDSRMWDPQFEFFAARFRVVRYDHRGFGKSTLIDGPYTLRGDLLNVLAHLGIATATIVGCSMGGAIAIDFTLEHPEVVAGLVLVGSGVSGLNDPKELSEEALKHWAAYLSMVQKGDVDGARAMDAKYWIDGPRRDAAQIDPVYRERALMLHRQNFSLERDAHQEQPLTPPAIGRLGEISARTIVVIGDNDSQDLIKLASKLAGEIPGARLITIAEAAHLPSLERPELFNRILTEFLDSSG
ncbi:MAG TPA: alpha/beta fold hydrolase [Candidatus Binataceae bacterium]|nr:alpha/beta fold hydrolase [Candidatus Binataceae bacterium]